LRWIRGKWREIRLKEEEEERNPCTGLANPHRTATTEKAVYLLLSSLPLETYQPLTTSSLLNPPKLPSKTAYLFLYLIPRHEEEPAFLTPFRQFCLSYC